MTKSPTFTASGLQARKGLEILALGDYSAYRDICHKVKTSYRPFLREAAGMMADLLTLPSDGVLIPMPSHLGYATDTLDLCKELSSLTGLPVMDILHGDMRESIHNLKSLTGEIPTDISLGFRLTRDVPCGLRPLVVDNVIGTGFTMKAALALIPECIPCTLAVDYRRCTL